MTNPKTTTRSPQSRGASTFPDEKGGQRHDQDAVRVVVIVQPVMDELRDDRPIQRDAGSDRDEAPDACGEPA
jgi:hypothetical protein